MSEKQDRALLAQWLNPKAVPVIAAIIRRILAAPAAPVAAPVVETPEDEARRHYDRLFPNAVQPVVISDDDTGLIMGQYRDGRYHGPWLYRHPDGRIETGQCYGGDIRETP